LCLAAGGGRQGPLYAAAGADVTVLDISAEMLARDRAVAAERRIHLRTTLGSMDDLSMFAAGEFDIVIHPVSTCYVPDVAAVYIQVARVMRGGGLYVSQHKSPVSLQAEISPAGDAYRLIEPYYRDGPLPPAAKSRLREHGTHEFLHRWEQLLGNMCRAGFAIEDLIEPRHAQPQAERGTFAHRACYIAPYVRVKARRQGEPPGARSVRLG
jgi:SAM-dependent methyltransferase